MAIVSRVFFFTAVHGVFFLSFATYMYVIHNSWIDENFPNPLPLLLLSILSVFSLFTFVLSTILVTVIHFGWPTVIIPDMPSVPKAIYMFTIFGYYFLLLGISCTLYIMILRKRGKFGHNNVHILDQRQIEEIELSSMNSNTNQNEERTSHTVSSHEIHFSLPIEEDGLERKRQLAEIQSAMRSLETNFVFTSILILTYVIANFFSNPVSVNVFICLKVNSPIVTTIINFVKIQHCSAHFWKYYYIFHKLERKSCSCFCLILCVLCQKCFFSILNRLIVLA